MQPSPLLEFDDRALPETDDPPPALTSAFLKLGRAALAAATAHSSPAAHQQHRVRWKGVETVAQVSVRFNRIATEERQVDHSWSGTSSLVTAVQVPKLATPYESASLSYLETDGLYGDLLPKDWVTAGAVLTLLGGSVSALWAVHVREPGGWRCVSYVRSSIRNASHPIGEATLGAVRHPIRLRFGQTLKPFADRDAPRDAHPSYFFAPSEDRAQRPAPPPHARLIACLRSLSHLGLPSGSRRTATRSPPCSPAPPAAVSIRTRRKP